MERLLYKLEAVQNLGLIDRVVRILLGFALFGIVSMNVGNVDTVHWFAYLPILAIYPVMTGVVGWDPFYAAAHVKSCDTSPRNQCGTLPYEIESALGKEVHCGDGYDCSISGSKHDAASHSHS